LQIIAYLGQKALNDAGLPYDRVQQACVGYCYGIYVQFISNVLWTFIK